MRNLWARAQQFLGLVAFTGTTDADIDMLVEEIRPRTESSSRSRRRSHPSARQDIRTGRDDTMGGSAQGEVTL